MFKKSPTSNHSINRNQCCYPIIQHCVGSSHTQNKNKPGSVTSTFSWDAETGPRVTFPPKINNLQDPGMRGEEPVLSGSEKWMGSDRWGSQLLACREVPGRMCGRQAESGRLLPEGGRARVWGNQGSWRLWDGVLDQRGLPGERTLPRGAGPFQALSQTLTLSL